MSLNYVVLLLGSNKNFPEKNVDKAIELISSSVGEVIVKSTKINTVPVEFVSKNNFCNIALSIRTKYSPIKLLDELKKIERFMGRLVDSAASGKYEDRIIDIDVVCFNHVRYISSRLKLPHQKHLFERDFSKILLNEINTTHTQI